MLVVHALSECSEKCDHEEPPPAHLNTVFNVGKLCKRCFGIFYTNARLVDLFLVGLSCNCFLLNRCFVSSLYFFCLAAFFDLSVACDLLSCSC